MSKCHLAWILQNMLAILQLNRRHWKNMSIANYCTQCFADITLLSVQRKGFDKWFVWIFLTFLKSAKKGFWQSACHSQYPILMITFELVWVLNLCRSRSTTVSSLKNDIFYFKSSSIFTILQLRHINLLILQS